MFRDLVRKNKQLSMEECLRVLKNEKRGVLSVYGLEGYPYGMPMNHWYNEDDGCVYFHCGNVGHRLEALRQCGKVSFCVYDGGVQPGGQWYFVVDSVIVFGQVEILDDPDLITDITTKLSYKFTQDDELIREEIRNNIHRTLLLRLTPDHICGKRVTES